MSAYKPGERPTYSEVALNWEHYADHVEHQRDDLLAALQIALEEIEAARDPKTAGYGHACNIIEIVARAAIAKAVQS